MTLVIRAYPLHVMDNEYDIYLVIKNGSTYSSINIATIEIPTFYSGEQQFKLIKPINDILDFKKYNEYSYEICIQSQSLMQGIRIPNLVYYDLMDKIKFMVNLM